MVGISRASSAPPSFDALLADLRLVRERGLGNLRHYAVPALHDVCDRCDLLSTSDASQEPAAVEDLLRRAAEHVGGGRSGEAAAYTLGLVSGTRLWGSTERRRAAAKAQGVSTDRFRKGYEPQLLEQVAEGVLAVCHERRLRDTRAEIEQRHPADSRLAVQWVERFEAYYRVWTPAWQLAADLDAAVVTYRDQPADHLPWDPNSDVAYDPADQARGYARYALYAFAAFQLEVRKFMTKHGGLWLLSDADVEQTVADAIYRIGWHNPLNEEEHSWLRRMLADARGEEQEHFRHLLLSTTEGSAIHGQWQQHVASCKCPSTEDAAPTCQVHLTIQACQEYCDLIDADWLKIADWYRPGSNPRPGLSSRTLYSRLVE